MVIHYGGIRQIESWLNQLKGHQQFSFQRLQDIAKTGGDRIGQERKPEENGKRFNVLFQIR